MFVTLPSAALFGVDAYRVDVEIDVAGGLPLYHVVGLAATAVKEGASRIRAALKNCGQDLPARKITVNLAPADRRKDGASFDLPIAVGVAIAGGLVPPASARGLMLLGELGLDGALRPVRGALAAAALARELGLRGIVLPSACAAEAAVVPGIVVHPFGHLKEVLAALAGGDALPAFASGPTRRSPGDRPGDFAEVRGQVVARRAVEIAVAGGHNLFLYGPPGAGKTMIASRVPTILPEMSHDEAIEVTKIYSAAGLSPPEGLVGSRPFRAPHHTISPTALVGGGAIPRPGEISLAHRGVLFLDELPEFARSTIEVLRQPLEERCVRIGRVAGSVRLPASFLLVASANPCPCGWHGCPERACTCSPPAIERYRARLSGPLLDRIDLQVRVASVPVGELRAPADAESSAVIRARVEEARARQLARLAGAGARLNAELDARTTRRTCVLTPAAERALARLCGRTSGMTARGIDRVVRIARTIADLAGADVVDHESVLEAAAYRALELDPVTDPRCLRPAPLPPEGP